MKVAKLVSISRGFGGDNAIYESRHDDLVENIIVSVGWALLAPLTTTIIINGTKVAEFTDKKYIQPHVALGRLGYAVNGLVDFGTVEP